MKCAHCKIDIDNKLEHSDSASFVVMKDDTICCYTCGRLKADMFCTGDKQHTYIKAQVLYEREDLYGV